MSIEATKGAIIKRSRLTTRLHGGAIVIYRNMTILSPNNKSQIIRNVLMSHYLIEHLQVKKPYRLFFAKFTIPIAFFQSGYFIARQVNCIFGLYDGRDVREDINNTINALRSYRNQVVIVAICLAGLAAFLTIAGGVWVFLAMFIMAWFIVVAIFGLFLKVDNVQTDMEELVDLDRNNWEVPEVSTNNESPQKGIDE